MNTPSSRPRRIASLSLLLAAGCALAACQGPAVPGPSAALNQGNQPARLQAQSDQGISHASRKLQNNLIGLFDKNGDGRLDQSELRIPLLLRLLDKNRDGFLTRDELQHPLADKLVTTFLRETGKRLYGLADRNDDKSLSYQEFIVASDMDHKLMKLLFQMVDNNFDDRLDASEYEDFIAQSIAVGGEGLDGLSRTAGFLDAVK